MAHVRATGGALLWPILLLATACSASGTTTTEVTHSEKSTSVPNQGGDLEGHMPTAFAGMGTGLFAGDNLNPSFPDGVGVQLYLTFSLPSDVSVRDAQIVSDALHISGAPFDDLGPLIAEPVTYESFEPELFDMPAIGPYTECTVTDDTSIACDVSAAIHELVNDGGATAQFRIRFTRPSDGDGQQDLAMFFRTESNTNESGVFELEITPDV